MFVQSIESGAGAAGGGEGKPRRHPDAEQARKRSQRTAAQYARTTAAQQKEAERDAERWHREMRLAEVASLNAQLEQVRDALASLLTATLDVDDFVDLEGLRIAAEHPPFGRQIMEMATPPVFLVTAQEEPVFVEPEGAKGLGGLFGKKKHAEAVAAARADCEDPMDRVRELGDASVPFPVRPNHSRLPSRWPALDRDDL